jgi:tetratricopeptide (TPR) repeat protein
MYYNIIPLLLILAGAAVIIRIVIKKFPAVVNLDVAALPQERERETKQRIINTRFKRSLNRWFGWLRRMALPAFEKLKAWGQEGWHKLLAARDNLSRTTIMQRGGSPDAIAGLLTQAETAREKEDFETAEQCYIRAISLESKNIAAFKLLGQLYFDQGKLAEARETLEHVLKLTQEDADVYTQLAEVAKSEQQPDKAKEYYQQSLKLNSENARTLFRLAELTQEAGNYAEALKNMKAALNIEPKNPRYLDGLFMVSILNKDKSEALDAYKALKEINPENAKLGEMKKQIDEL